MMSSPGQLAKTLYPTEPSSSPGRLESHPVRVMVVVGSLEMGGAQKHIFDLVRQLDPSKFEMSFVVLGEGGHFYHKVQKLGYSIYSLNVQKRRHLVSRIPAFFRYVRETDPDVLHLFLYETSVFGCLVRLLRGRSGPRVILSKRSMELDLRTDRDVAYRYFLMRVPDVITAVSESVRQRCIELGAPPAKVLLIENGIEPVEVLERGKLRALLGLGEDTLLVGAVGALTVRKRHRLLLNAMPRLLAEFADVHVVLLGEGNLRSELEAEGRRLGIEHRLHLPGMLIPALSYIADLSVFVLPSSEEGMSNALLEAMMAGLPCIGSDIPSNREVITDGRDGLLVDVEDPEAFTAAIRKLLADADLRHSMGAQARETTRRRFSPRRMVEANEDLYLTLARQRLKA